MGSGKNTSPWIEVRHRNAAASIARKQPERTIVDVTSRAAEPWVRFSPFYPHDDIPVPFSQATAASVEGVWQGLKVFEGTGIDRSVLENRTMRGLKRTVRRFGRVLGHQRGLDDDVDGQELLNYGQARELIYLPTYAWVLDHKLGTEIAELVRIATDGPVTLLDYETNSDPTNLTKPLSHAALVARRVTAELARR